MQAIRRLPEMFRLQPTEQYKAVIILLGTICVLFAITMLPAAGLSFGLVALLLFAVFIAPRMSLTLPRSDLYVSFSDSVVFFSFLAYGGRDGIIVGG